jgi:hypothetical protein
MVCSSPVAAWLMGAAATSQDSGHVSTSETSSLQAKGNPPAQLRLLPLAGGGVPDLADAEAAELVFEPALLGKASRVK